ncbi:hypothetical protein, variant 1 [Aphanomyces astaci]|nr:hypothetical protein, variant 1 [Aphanomyces astaci]ETV81715.1 hypothetical protein, variant 1 [Aphanomyces astaci]|eukprot:XP_009828452.1 hypothetical protein, variant 1 [Aphanomyces astaci]
MPLHLKTIRKRMQEPTSLQMQIDDFIESAGEGLDDRVDQYVRAGLPIDRTHTVLGYTALHAAANQPDGRVMARLLRAGANVNATAMNHQGTALHAAVLYNNQSGVEKLLQHQAHRLARAQGDVVPADIAMEYGRRTIHNILKGPPPPPHLPKCTLVEPQRLHITWEVKPRSRLSANRTTPPPPPTEFKVLWRMWCANDFTHATCKAPVFVVQGLVPATLYEITVQAANDAGWSDTSAPLVVKTAETTPTAPKAPVITFVSEKSITMGILLPESNGAALDAICVLVQKTGSIDLCDTSDLVALMQVNPHDTAWTVVWEGHPSTLRPLEHHDPSVREFVASTLAPGTVYFYRVKARNALGWSDLGDVSDGITTNDAPKLVHKTGTSLGLVWPKPYSTHDIDMYELQCKVAATTDWSVVSSRIRGQSHTVSQLSPATGYVFRVRPHFANMRQGQCSSSSWETESNCVESHIYHTHGATPDPPSDVVLVSRSQSMLEVRWKMPRCNGHVVLHYELQKQRMDEVKSTQSILSDAKPDPAAPWESVSNTIEVDCATYRVQGLMHGTPYRFRLRARNALGWSVDGDPSVAFFTHAFLPPTPPLATAKTHYSLDIAWRDQQADVNNNVDLKEYFELHLCRLWTYCPHDAIPDIRLDTWDVVQDRCPTRSCVVSNLSALSWYAFRVRSWIRHRGWTEFSDPSRPIQTLRRM